MKLYILRTLPSVMLLISTQLLEGYAIVHDKDSPFVSVDIYVRPAKDAAEARKKHASYLKKLGIPDTVVEVFEVAKGVSEPIGKFLDKPTKGKSLVVAKGVKITADTLKKANEQYGKEIKGIIGRIDRGKDEAFHSNVVRGNRGRDAEWAVDKDMYAIVTKHDDYAILGEPQFIPARSIAGFTITLTPDPDNPGNQIETADFNPKFTAQYIRSENDTRDKNKMKELAKTNGEYAFVGREPTATELAETERRAQEAKKAVEAKASAEALKALGLPVDATNYQVLGVAPTASQTEITNAYKALVLKWYPDKNPANKELATKVFNKIQEAYNALRVQPKK